MMKVQVNDKNNFTIETKEGITLIDGIEVNADIIDDAGGYHILHNNRSYSAEVIAADKSTKTFKVKINHNIYDVKLSDQYDELLRQLGFDKQTALVVNDLKAPMPGLVVSVLVKEGDVVKKGDSVIILEAMKMENVLKAAADVTVKKVKVNKGDKVEKNEVMILFEV